MALSLGGVLGIGASNPATDPVQVAVTPDLNVGVGGSLLTGTNSGSLVNLDLNGLLGADTGGVLDLGNVLGGTTGALDLSSLLGGSNGGVLDLNSLLGSGTGGALDLSSLLNSLSGADLSTLMSNGSLLGLDLSSLLGQGGVLGDLLGGDITVNIGDTLHNIGIDIPGYHPPGPGPDNPNNPPPGTASDGVQIYHTARGDVMIGTSKDDTMTGNVGNDQFFGLGGNDKIDGSYGLDAAFYRGKMSDYTVGINNGQLTITDGTAGRDGVDTVSNVERIVFNDSTLAFDINGDAGQAYRIYQAAFGRTPDQPGVSFWTHRLDTGETLKQVAAEFVGSAEFQAKYGVNPSNATFINALYQNVLNRPADATGVAYWTNEMNKGMSRGDILASFSESAENHAKVDPGLQTGIHLDYGIYA